VLLGAGTWAALEYVGFRTFGVGIRWYSTVGYQYTGVEEAVWRTVYGFLEWLLIGGAATFMYLDARRARIEQGRLRRAEIDRALTAKRMLESQLQAMQARVEPQFLFNSMAQVRRLYDMDAPLAERVLDELIAYLRAAMPQLRDTTSTVRREIELVRAYLDIVRLPLGERPRVRIEVHDLASDGRMPPMMLLPLFDHSVAEHRDPRRSAGTLAIVGKVVAGRLRISIVDSGAGLVSATSTERIADASERLAALYGTAATLQLSRASDNAMRIVLDIPFEPADGPLVRAVDDAPEHAS
jgi:LytS/YehU family sensor histidine kinase